MYIIHMYVYTYMYVYICAKKCVYINTHTCHRFWEEGNLKIIFIDTTFFLSFLMISSLPS